MLSISSGTVSSGAGRDCSSSVFSMWTGSVEIHRVSGCSLHVLSASSASSAPVSAQSQGSADNLVDVLHLRNLQKVHHFGILHLFTFVGTSRYVSTRTSSSRVAHGFCTA